jgi:hypothetical protein
VSWIKVGGQKRRVEVTLHRANATRALVKAQGERLFERLAAAVTELTELRCAWGDFEQGAARARPRCASKVLQTSLGLAVPRFVHTASATLYKKAVR